MNPIYKREMMVSARGFRLALVMLVFNGILALVALLNMYSTLVQVRLTAEIQYTSFLNLYLFVAVLEFVMVIFIMPALTAGSISGERERRTLELMLATKMTPAQVVLGKLMSSCSTMALMIVSSFPVIAMVFVYGGVTVQSIVMLLLCYSASALFVGSVGILCSALLNRSTISTVATYVATAFVVGGTYGVNWLAQYMQIVHSGAYLASTGQGAAAGSTGALVYLLLFNPIATFLMTIQRLSGQSLPAFGSRFLAGAGRIGSGGWIGCSIVLQLMAAAVCIWFAVRVLTPKRSEV